LLAQGLTGKKNREKTRMARGKSQNVCRHLQVFGGKGVDNGFQDITHFPAAAEFEAMLEGVLLSAVFGLSFVMIGFS
jgi:hypothetical protein